MPLLANSVRDRDEREAVSRLLNLVQTGFEYEYDEKVWGHDRPFFAEETLYYPFCDCEDRAILLSRLVRDLLGLRTLLVFYPGHLAMAVALTRRWRVIISSVKGCVLWFATLPISVHLSALP